MQRRQNSHLLFALAENFNKLFSVASKCRRHSKESLIEEMRDKINFVGRLLFASQRCKGGAICILNTIKILFVTFEPLLFLDYKGQALFEGGLKFVTSKSLVALC